VGREFVINLPPASLAKEVDFVGIYTGAKMDKFERCSLTRIKSDKVAPPTVAECPIALECRVTEVIPMGSHHVFMADIVGISCREELIDSEGKIHFENADLLAYAHGEYYTLGNRVGKFGFSTDRPKKQENKPAQKAEKPAPKTEKSAEQPKPVENAAPEAPAGEGEAPAKKRRPNHHYRRRNGTALHDIERKLYHEMTSSFSP
jgi:hypothetical protein